MRVFSKLKKAAYLFWNDRYRRAMFFGVGAAIEHEKVMKSLLLKTVVDVGANRGQFALLARECFKNAQVISFEPLSGPRKKFQKIFATDRNIILHPVALGMETGEQVIHVSAKDDSSSLLLISDLQNKIFPGTEEVVLETIHITTLDKVLLPDDIVIPALLKLDVQGYELLVLRGCGDLLHKFKYVYLECSFVELYEGQPLASEVMSFLLERGFLFNGAYNMFYDREGLAVQCDILFSNCAGGV